MTSYIGVPDWLPPQEGAAPPVECGDDEPGRLAGAEEGVVVVVGVHDDVGGGAVDICMVEITKKISFLLIFRLTKLMCWGPSINDVRKIFRFVYSPPPCLHWANFCNTGPSA